MGSAAFYAVMYHRPGKFSPLKYIIVKVCISMILQNLYVQKKNNNKKNTFYAKMSQLQCVVNYVIITVTERALRATHFGLSLSDSARHRSKRSINLRGNAEKSTNSPCWLFRLGGKMSTTYEPKTSLSCANCLDLQPRTETLSMRK